MSEIDPLDILAIPDDGDWPPGARDRDLFGPAISLALRGGLSRVRGLLKSENPIVRSRGLFVYVQLGRQGYELIDDALEAAGGLDSWGWSELLDGVLSYPDKIGAERLALLLPLVADPVNLVRARLVTILACQPDGVIEEAVQLLDPALRAAHARAAERASAIDGVSQAAFDTALELDPVDAVYCWAALDRHGRRYPVVEFEHIHPGDDYLAEWVRFQIVRHSKRYEADRAYRSRVFEDLERARRD